MPAPTERLHHDDPTRLAFEARVVARAAWQGRASVVLDRTAFYPESGGQPADTGALGDIAVVDVQVDDDGVVHHVLADGAAQPALDATLVGRVDAARRRLHMALHTGQHMLSRALLDEARAETVSSRLAPGGSTVDVDVSALDEAAVARAEALVQQVIEDDRPVRQWFPEAGELAGMALRRAPKVSENVRVVDVGGFDLSPCGGTHCTRTAQVRGLTVTGVERYKGRMRVTFLAGRAAWDELSARSRTLTALARAFTCGPHDVPAAVERLRAELQGAREAAGAARQRWAELYATALVADARAGGEGRVACALDDAPVETLRALAAKITAGGLVAMVASRERDGVQVVVARPEGSAFDCGAWLKRACAEAGGRGGGRPERAEGRLPPAVDWARVTAV